GSTLINAPIGTITPATLTVVGASADNKIYDGTTAAALNNTGASLVGVLSSDFVNLSSPTTGTFASSNVGTWTVTVNGVYTLAGRDGGNYNLIQPTGISAEITPKQLSAVIIGNPTKTYDGNVAAILTSSNYALSGFIGSQGATVTQTVGSYGL